MATVRIYMIAELLNMSSQDVVNFLKKESGIEVKSASSTIEEVVAASVVERVARQRRITLPDKNLWFRDTVPVPPVPTLRPRLVKTATQAEAESSTAGTSSVPVHPARTTRVVPPSIRLRMEDPATGQALAARPTVPRQPIRPPAPIKRPATSLEPRPPDPPRPSISVGQPVVTKPAESEEHSKAARLSRPEAHGVSPDWQDTVWQALDLLPTALEPRVSSELQKEFGNGWQQRVLGKIATDRRTKHLNLKDPLILLRVITGFWDVFSPRIFPRGTRSFVEEIREVRNSFVHREMFAIDDAFRAVDTIHRLLTRIDAPEARRTAEIRLKILRELVAALPDGR